MADKQSRENEVLNAIFNPLLPLGDVTPLENDAEYTNGVIEEGNDVLQAKELEILGVRSAENRDYEMAEKYFNEAIEICPKRASGYNNRAQLLRLKGDEEKALEDLEKAIDLGKGHGKVCAQAYTQRGLLRRLKGDEEGALYDFKKATALGSSFAKSMVVQMNPYAAMCNQMLAEVIGKLQRGEEEEY